MATARVRVSLHDYPDRVYDVKMTDESGELLAWFPGRVNRAAFEVFEGFECYQYDWEFQDGDRELYDRWMRLLDTLRRFVRRPLWEKMGLDVRV